MTLGGKRITLQAVGDGFDLVHEGVMFQVLWEAHKRKNAFTWENKNKKHDAFEVKNFGENVDRVVAPTTREVGTRQAMGLNTMAREAEPINARGEESKSG